MKQPSFVAVVVQAQDDILPCQSDIATVAIGWQIEVHHSNDRLNAQLSILYLLEALPETALPFLSEWKW